MLIFKRTEQLMKYIITILLLSLACASKSQTFINRSGAANTVIDQRLGAAQNFFLPRLIDTTLSGGLDSIGNLIYDRLRAKIAIRDTVLTGGHKFTFLFKQDDTISTLATQYDLTQIPTQNISNAALTANGNYSQNWSESQWYVDSIAGSFLFRMGGIGSTGTRRKEFRINWGGSSFGDNLDGFNMLASIKKADLSADSLTMGLQSSGTGVLSMGTYNIAASSNNNFISYSATSGLININAKDSIWMKGATPAATADSLLGTLVRGANGTSKVVKIPISAAGGTTPSWQQTLNVGNTTSSTLYHDTTMVGNPVEKLWHKYEPLVKTDTATTAFYDWQFSGSNNGSFNEVRMFGWNLNAGGGQVIAGKPALGESWESNYQTNPAYPAASDRLVEKHEIYVTPAGTQHRLGSYTINTNTGTINYYHTVGGFSLHNVDTHTPYFSWIGSADNSQMSFINSTNQSEVFNVSTNFEQDASTANFTITAGSGKPSNLFNVMGFSSASLPSASINGLGYDGAEISFYGAATGQLSKFLSDSSETRLANLTNVPINFVVDGITSFATYKTKAKMSVPLAVNSNNFAAAPFAALEALASSASLEAGGWFRHDGTAASNKYGLEVSAIGANGTNEALYLNASNATNNRAIRIQFPSAGASNHAIYSDATAQSYFAGKIGIGSGVTSPDSTLQINGSFHNNAGVRMEGLPSGPGTKAVRIDANGNLSTADTSAGSANEESYTSTYTNYSTTATYQAVDSITLTAGDWFIDAQGTFSANGATITASSDAIFAISTTRASASGVLEGKNIVYISQGALLGTNHQSVSIAPYLVSVSSTTKYYLNSQATFTLGNPQCVGGLHSTRVR